MKAPPTPMSREVRLRVLRGHYLSTGEDLAPDRFPVLHGTWALPFYRWVEVPQTPRPRTEYVHVNVDTVPSLEVSDEHIKFLLGVSEWNSHWESAHLRPELYEDELPPKLRWLTRCRGRDICLLPNNKGVRYAAYAVLYHLLPLRVLERFGLPPLNHGVWPPDMCRADQYLLPDDFADRFTRAFAYHIWPLLSPRSPPSAFAVDEPIRVLAHDLDFWLPYADEVVRDVMESCDPAELEENENDKLIPSYQAQCPPEIRILRPRYGDEIWIGEDEAWSITEEIVCAADAGGRLTNLIDAVRSHRVEDDFSPRWSFEREDFERKLYRKRSKVRVSFIELDDTIPVHGPEAEIHNGLFYQNLVALLDQKERRVVVCLRNGTTNLAEIARELGYANHSPISKALDRIRRKAARLLEK